MKKNKLHIVLSVFLLALVLAGRVGIHVFHQHESSDNLELAAFKKAHPETPILTDLENDTDCALCKLDTFQEISITTFAAFIFFLLFEKTLYSFFLYELISFSFFTKSRGPPSFASIS